ncbi:MAG: THUMP domain-containing protein [Candidatus Iainarchaeum sp.]|nr:MAG: tRNA s(4)U8 sulfurtransferase [archaeon ADurb.Bin336]
MFEPNCVIALIAPEISIKSSFVRSFMVNKLKKNIILYLDHFGLEYENIYYVAGRLIIPTKDPKKVLSVLKNCFGVLSLCPAQSFEFDSLNDICSKVGGIIEGRFSNESFAIRGKSFSKKFSSKKLEEELGGVVLNSFPKMKVKLKNPDKEVFCIVQNKNSFVYFESFSSVGGMPVGVQGKAGIICNSKTNKEDLFLVGKNLFKVGASIIIVSNEVIDFDLSELEKFNSFIKIKTIPVALARTYSENGGLKAFFSCAKNESDFKTDCELIGEKVFAPLLF